jgi:hypothetical protein
LHPEGRITSDETRANRSIRDFNMSKNLAHAAFHLSHDRLETSFIPANDAPPEPRVALVAGGAVLGFDGGVHIDLDRAHTVLSPDDARQFAAGLKQIADMIDPYGEVA